jgi:hypothetical protein
MEVIIMVVLPRAKGMVMDNTIALLINQHIKVRGIKESKKVRALLLFQMGQFMRAILNLDYVMDGGR